MEEEEEEEASAASAVTATGTGARQQDTRPVRLTYNYKVLARKRRIRASGEFAARPRAAQQKPQAHLFSQGRAKTIRCQVTRRHYQCLRVVHIHASADRRRTTINHPKPFAVRAFALE